jgi:subtilase family protein/fervidolysin-like protein
MLDRRMTPARSVMSLVVALWLGSVAPTVAADSLAWRAAESRVDAQVEGWPLARVLETITAATGWQVYVEPGTEHTVTTQFTNLKPADALLRLLGDVNFALLPRADGPSELFVYRHSVSAATQLVPRRSRAGKPIGNELILTLKRGSKRDLASLEKKLHATIVGRLEGIGAYRLRFDDDPAARKARTALEGDADVESVESNIVMSPPADLQPLAMSSVPPLSLSADISPSSGKVVVGLIDSAVQGQAVPFGGFLQPGISLEGDYQPPADRITHGTAMAETILDGVAGALRDQGDGSGKVPLSILPIDIYGADESTTAFDVARGMVQALDQHANIINLSLGGENDSALLRNLIQTAADHGVLVFAAAGNTPVVTPTYPAADPGAMAVTAGDAQGNLASYANHGPFVDLVAPGTNVVQYADRAWLGTGTSFSTGWVSGWAAGFMASTSRSFSATETATLQRWGMRSNGGP